MADHFSATPNPVTVDRVLAMATGAGFNLDHVTDPVSGEELVAGMVGDYPANILLWQDWLLIRLDHPTGSHDNNQLSSLLLAANRCNNAAPRARTLIIDTPDQFVVRTDYSVDIGEGLTDTQLKAVIRQSFVLAMGAMESFHLARKNIATG
ncbi:hypothetical protein ACFSSC_04105 [Corynebacterium mendelii]|uniref:YbjN domain-containing protein n=1 Tax=Corynebacterium mendelii TaxID=2765362 RepID=A0A939E0U6_9CORY|nr:hypothetical protein [Corynebacterium mendelii]MBN9643412.1 hypothetical protein [Corynebacterium mendelii]